jgi:hypothetical protein
MKYIKRKNSILRINEFERPNFCESYYAYKKIIIKKNGIKNNKELNKALYIRDGFELYCKYMWNDYVASVRGLIYSSIKRGGWEKESRTQEILGCDFKFFKDYIESIFAKGMNWENHGKWHLDHIYPVSKSKSKQHCLELNHYTNFQPLWAIDNLTKGAKIL